MTNPLATIIIPHWNGRHHLDDCFNALRQQTFTNFETILVDNGSTDGSQAYTRQHYPEVRLIELGHNTGFTGACNAGYQAAEGEIIILLNNDTEADSNWLAELIAPFDNNPQIGSVIGKILLFDQRDTFHTAGDLYHLDGTPANRGVWQKDEGQYDQPERVFSGCGAAVAYRRDTLNQVGFLDNSLYFSCEDVDLGWRINLAGYQVWYQPTAIIYHKLKASGGSGATSSYYDGRNFLFLIWKNYPTTLLRQHWLKILRAQWRIATEAAVHWRGEAARARLKGQLAGLFGFFKLLPQRRQIQAARRITDDELTALLSPPQDS